MVGLFLATYAPCVPSAAKPVAVSVAAPLWRDLEPGARVSLVATSGTGVHERETLTFLGGCAEVVAADPGPSSATLDLSLNRAGAREVRSIPADAAVRVVLCGSSADPLSRALGGDRRAAPLPSSVPADFASQLHAGDRVDVLVGIPGTPSREGKTVTLLRDVEVLRDAWGRTTDPASSASARADVGQIALGLSPADAEKYFHAQDLGNVALTLRPRPSPTGGPEHVATILPAGMVLAAAEAPSQLGVAPFLDPGDYVDVMAVVQDRGVAFLQAVFTMPPMEQSGPTSPVLALLKPDEAEMWMHAVTFVPTGYALRNPEDVEFVDPKVPRAAPRDQPPPTGPPASRIAPGTRGLVLAVAGAAPAVHDHVGVQATGCPDGTRLLPIEPALVLAVIGEVALVQVSPADALAVMRASAACEAIAATR